MLKNLRTETTIGIEFKNKLIDVVGRRLGNLEKDKIVAKSTLLDPRLKKTAFGLQENADNAHKWICEELTNMICAKNDNTEITESDTTQSTSSANICSVWKHFDDKVAQFQVLVQHQKSKHNIISCYLHQCEYNMCEMFKLEVNHLEKKIFFYIIGYNKLQIISNLVYSQKTRGFNLDTWSSIEPLRVVINFRLVHCVHQIAYSQRPVTINSQSFIASTGDDKHKKNIKNTHHFKPIHSSFLQNLPEPKIFKVNMSQERCFAQQLASRHSQIVKNQVEKLKILVDYPHNIKDPKQKENLDLEVEVPNETSKAIFLNSATKQIDNNNDIESLTDAISQPEPTPLISLLESPCEIKLAHFEVLPRAQYLVTTVLIRKADNLNFTW
ncbi:hypothetical protein QTP88_028730 [Uroleucon formosanum]